MIEGIGNAIVALDAAHREDIELLHHQRKATANAWAARISDYTELCNSFVHAMKTDAAAQDADFAKAIARREHMLGEQPMQYQQAAE